MPLFQFIGAALGASAMVTLASFVWPKVTSQPRPEALSKVYEVVSQTPIGQSIEQVLGDQTVDVQEIVASKAAEAVTSVTNSVKRNTVLKMFEALPDEEKAAFRAAICEPAEQ